MIPIHFGLVRRLVLSAVVAALMLPLPAVALSPSAPLTNFPTETEAQRHCPSDTVAWLNLPTGVYHLKGQRWYGRTKNGAYVCRNEADRVGMRGSLNGQSSPAPPTVALADDWQRV
ncbi:MAG: hypothetical protein WA184_13445 [Stellaceae bacterium]